MFRHNHAHTHRFPDTLVGTHTHGHTHRSTQRRAKRHTHKHKHPVGLTTTHARGERLASGRTHIAADGYQHYH